MENYLIIPILGIIMESYLIIPVFGHYHGKLPDNTDFGVLSGKVT
jgi:hypothetical protein